jgi:DegV family protein with EDD domain
MKEFSIYMVPVGMIIQGKHYRDTVDITFEDFWPKFFDLKEQPSTTACNPGDFVNLFTELQKTTSNIVCVLVSRAISATQESAYQAKRIVREQYSHLNIEIVDSKTSAGAVGFIALEAARAAKNGKNLEEVASVAREISTRVYYVAALDTIKYLIKTGRAPGGATLGEFLHLKPIIGFVDDTGLLEVVTRVRGSSNSLKKLVDLIKKYADPNKPLHAIVHYTDDIKRAENLKEMICTKFKVAEMHITRYTPVMLSGTGPTVGVSFYS